MCLLKKNMLSSRGNSIDFEFRKVQTKLIQTYNKWKKNYQIDPVDRANPAIILDPMDHDPSDPKVQNEWFYSFQISLITL